MPKIPGPIKQTIGNLAKTTYAELNTKETDLAGRVTTLITRFNSNEASVSNSPEEPKTNHSSANLPSCSRMPSNEKKVLSVMQTPKQTFLPKPVLPAKPKLLPKPILPSKQTFLPKPVSDPKPVLLYQPAPTTFVADSVKKSILPSKNTLIKILQDSNKPTTPLEPIQLPKQALLDAFHTGNKIAENKSQETQSSATERPETEEESPPTEESPKDTPLKLTKAQEDAGKKLLKRWKDKNFQLQFKKDLNELGVQSVKFKVGKETETIHYINKKPFGFQSTKDEIMSDQEEESGLSKRLETKGEYFVSLKMIEADTDIKKLIQINEKTASYFKGLHAIKPTYFVDSTHAIAKNGGTCLVDFMFENGDEKQGKCVPLKYFEAALADLKTLHERGAHLIDIKLDNMAIENKKVSLIDTDDFLTKDDLLSVYTKNYAVDLAVSIENISFYQKDNENQKLLMLNRTNMDSFATLLSMIEATEAELFDDVENIRRTGLEQSELPRALSWIDKNIKKEHQADVKLLVTDPTALVEKRMGQTEFFPKSVELFDAINWDKLD